MLLTGIVVSNMATALVAIRRLAGQPQAVYLRDILIGFLICRLLLEIGFLAAYHLLQAPGLTVYSWLVLGLACLFLNFFIIIAAWGYRKKLSPQETPTHQTLRLLLRLCPLEMLPAIGILIMPLGSGLQIWLSGQ